MIRLSGRSKCETCRLVDPILQEWHHINPDEKEFEVGHAIQHPEKYPDKIILKEIDKCQILCRNCHRKTYLIKDIDTLKYHKSRKERIQYINNIKIKLKCNICGINCNKNNLRSFDFHHRDPKAKKFSISKGFKYTILEIKKELKKCNLFCSNCHRYIHNLLGNKFIYNEKKYKDVLEKIRITRSL